MAALSQISSSLCTSLPGKSKPFSLLIFLNFCKIYCLVYLIFTNADVCVLNASRIYPVCRIPISNIARIGTSFASGSPLCKKIVLH